MQTDYGLCANRLVSHFMIQFLMFLTVLIMIIPMQWPGSAVMRRYADAMKRVDR